MPAGPAGVGGHHEALDIGQGRAVPSPWRAQGKGAEAFQGKVPGGEEGGGGEATSQPSPELPLGGTTGRTPKVASEWL